MSKKSLWLLPVAIVLYLGLAPEMAELLRLNPFRGGLSAVQRIVYLQLALFAPLVLGLALLRLTRKRISSTMGTLLIFAVIVYGVISSILLASGAGAGSGNAIMHGFALTFALTGIVAFMVQDPMHYWGGNLSLVMLTVATGAALYSLAGVPLAAWQTLRLAEGNPYCLATRAQNNYELRSIPDLRNFSVDMYLRPDLTGEIDLYPNHILVVQGSETRQFYYWSPAGMRFNPVTPEFPANGRLGRVCQPRPGYLWGLRPI